MTDEPMDDDAAAIVRAQEFGESIYDVMLQEIARYSVVPAATAWRIWRNLTLHLREHYDADHLAQAVDDLLFDEDGGGSE
jgi:hypothetical protein